MRAVTVGLCAHLIALASFADFHAFVSGNYGSSPFSLTTYDTATGSFGHFSQVPSGATKILASPNGAELWILGLTGPSSAETGYISIVSTTTQKVLATLPLPDVSPYSLCFNVCPNGVFNPNGNFVYATTYGESGSHLLVYSVTARKLLLNKTLTNIGGVASLAISPDGLHLFLTDTAQVASLSTSTLQATGSLSIQTLTLASAGNVLLAGGYSGLYLIDESTLAQQTLLSTDGLPSTIYVSADGTTALLVEQSNCSLGLTCALQIVNVPLQSITATDGNQSNAPVILSPDGNQITVFGVTDPLFKGSTGINFTETIDAQTFAVLQRGPLLSYLTPVYAGSTLFLYCWTNLVSIVDGSSQTVTAQIPIGSASVELAAVPGRNVVDAFTGYGLDIIERRQDTVRPSLALTLGSYTAFGVSATSIYGVGTSAVLSIDPITGQQRFLTPPNFPQPPDCFMTLGTPVVSPDQTKMIIATGNLCGPPPNYKMSLLPDESVAGLAIYNASNNTLIAQVSAFSSGTPIFSPDSAIAYLPNSYYPGGLNPSQINVIDLATATITGVWSLPENLEIGDMVISPDGKTVYALSESDVDGSGALLAIDTGSGTLVDQIPLPTTAGSLAIAPDGSKLLITGFGGANTNSLGVMDAVTGVISFVDTGSPTGSLVATN